MAERYFEGKQYSASAEKAQLDKDLQEEDERRHGEHAGIQKIGEAAFIREYNISEMIDTVYQRLNSKDERLDTKTKERLQRHLADEFGTLEGDTDTITESIQDEVERFLKMLK